MNLAVRKCGIIGFLSSWVGISCLLAISALLILPAFGELSPIEDDSGKVHVVLSAGEYSITKDESGFDMIQMEGFTEASSPGNPILPHKVYNVLVPPEAIGPALKLDIISADIQVLDGTYDIKSGAPASKSTDEYAEMEGADVEYWGEGKNIANGKNLNVYEKDANYPENYVELLPYSEMRKWKFARVDFIPIQYNPVSKKLTLIKSVEVEISYDLSPVELDRSLAADTVMDDVAPQIFVNYDEGRMWYEVEVMGVEPQATYDYVIITTNAIVSNSAKLNAFIAHKQSLGYSVKLVTESDFGGLTGQAPNQRAEKIRQWLMNNYASMGIKYVLLIGDPHPYESGEGDIPMKMCWPRYSETEDREAPTDYFYADLTGNWDKDGDQIYGEWSDYITAGGVDFTAEVSVGRIPVYDANYATLDSILQKIIDYETSSSTSWRKSILMPMGFQHPETWPDDPDYDPYDGAPLGEQMRNDYLNSNGYSSWRMYQQGSGTCGLNSIYTSEQELRGGTVVRDRWAAGDYGIVCWWGHGNPTQAVVGYGSYLYQPSPCDDGLLLDSSYNSVLDDAHPSFTYQCSCLNSYPENNNNLAYSILKRGGISTVSATRVSFFYRDQLYGDFDGTASNSGLGYEYVKMLVQDLRGGDALYMTKQSIASDIGLETMKLMNLYDFNLYGDPSVSLKNPTPATGWFGLGGYINSIPSMIVDDQGRTHIFAKGGDSGLWDNIDGTWYTAGGYLNSAPCAVKDSYGRIHVFIRGGDNALWDYAFNTQTLTGSWYGFGGCIASSVPSATLDPVYTDCIQVMVRGCNNALYRMEIYTPTMAGNWFGHGGGLTSSPYVTSDSSGNLHTFVRGGDNGLWDNVVDSVGVSTWYGLGGVLNTVIMPTAVIEPGHSSYLAVMVRGSDNGLWMCDLYTPSMTLAWIGFGGYLGSDPYVVSDTQGKIHTFVQGGDTAAWENVFSSSPWNPSGALWYGHGGCLNFYPVAIANGYTNMVVFGCDNGPWKKVYATIVPSTTDVSAEEATSKGVGYEKSEPASSILLARGAPSVSEMDSFVGIPADFVPLDAESTNIKMSEYSGVTMVVVEESGLITEV